MRKICSLLLTLCICITQFSVPATANAHADHVVLSKNETMPRHRAEIISVDTSNLLMDIGQTRQINVSAIFTDGIDVNVTLNSTFESSNNSVATVSANGLISVVGAGTTIITVNYDDFSTSFAIGVGIDIELISISVDGVAIGGSPLITNYMYVLPYGTTKYPEITYEAPVGAIVDVIIPEQFPGVVSIVVSDTDKLFTKTYNIIFQISAPPIFDKKPFIITGSLTQEGEFVHLDLNVIDNPYCFEEIPAEFTMVIQMLNRYGVPEYIIKRLSERQSRYSFRDDAFADIMIIDEFSSDSYIGMQLATPARMTIFDGRHVFAPYHNLNWSYAATNFSFELFELFESVIYDSGLDISVAIRTSEHPVEWYNVEILNGEEVLVVRPSNTSLGTHLFRIPTHWPEGDDYIVRAGRGGNFASASFKIRSNKDQGEDITLSFTDPEFLKALREILKKGLDEPIYEGDVSDMEHLYISGRNISSLAGIEHFKSLLELNCSVNQLTGLDLSSNKKLWRLDCNDNELISLDVTKNVLLEHLNCEENQLTTLDVSKNKELTDFRCSGNRLSSLDVSNNSELWLLFCDDNKLDKLDVSKNVQLTSLYCRYNHLTELDVSNNKELTNLGCTGNKLTSLDVSNNPELVWFYCEDNQLTELDVSNNKLLKYLDCRYNNIKTRDDVIGWRAVPEFYIYPQNGEEWILFGDVNGDGVVDEWDVTYLARHLAGWNGYENIVLIAADVSGDGVIDEWDVTYLARHLAGWNGYERLGAQ